MTGIWIHTLLWLSNNISLILPEPGGLKKTGAGGARSLLHYLWSPPWNKVWAGSTFWKLLWCRRCTIHIVNLLEFTQESEHLFPLVSSTVRNTFTVLGWYRLWDFTVSLTVQGHRRVYCEFHSEKFDKMQRNIWNMIITPDFSLHVLICATKPCVCVCVCEWIYYQHCSLTLN